MIPEPFARSAPDEGLQDLKQHLVRTRWPDQTPGEDPWAYGASVEPLRELIHSSGHDCD